MLIGIDRELTRSEIRAVQKLIKTQCANFDWEYGCLLLSDTCPMMHVGFTNSALCKYFRDVVLPNEPKLQVLFLPASVHLCKNCGCPFPAYGRKLYCSERCSAIARRRNGAERVRKYRKKVAQM